LQAAFRYNRRGNDEPKLRLEWRQFLDADVLSAVAERATVTTLTTVEGRSLTEISLRVRNHAKTFMKVELPAGAQLLSAEVAGERVKPVEGDDGSRRVPLLRAGLDSSKAYTVSFVYLSAGARFGRSGAYNMGLAKLDIPVNVLTWEISLPDRLVVKQFGGNALSADLVPDALANNFAIDGVDTNDSNSSTWADKGRETLQPGQIGGVVVDSQGAVIPGAEVTVSNTQTGASLTAKSDDNGRWLIAGVQPGPVSVLIAATGFKNARTDLQLQALQPAHMGTTLEVGNITETVTITDSSSPLNTRQIRELPVESRALSNLYSVSANVTNLQRRVAGILPVAIEVPKSGKAYRFVRPLVMEEETLVTFQYKSR
jgi:hypothetical protein